MPGFFAVCERIGIRHRLSGAVRTKSHILRRASHDQQRRQHQQSHREDAEHHPGLPPAERYQEPSRQDRHADFSKADAHARERKGAPAHAHKPLRDDDVDDHVTHRDIAEGHERQANRRKLNEAVDVPKQQENRFRQSPRRSPSASGRRSGRPACRPAARDKRR